MLHYAVTKYLRADLERIKQGAMQCIFPHLPYSAALVKANIKSINERHLCLPTKLLKEILENQNNKLNHQSNPHPIKLKKQKPLNVPRTKTDRFFNSYAVSGYMTYNDAKVVPTPK